MNNKKGVSDEGASFLDNLQEETKMWTYFCEKCKTCCDKDDIDLREENFEGDWQEFHIICDSKVLVILNPQTLN